MLLIVHSSSTCMSALLLISDGQGEVCVHDGRNTKITHHSGSESMKRHELTTSSLFLSPVFSSVIPGKPHMFLQVYRHFQRGYWRASKRWCKGLPKEEVRKALLRFPHNESSLRAEDVYGGEQGALSQLRQLLQWFEVSTLSLSTRLTFLSSLPCESQHLFWSQSPISWPDIGM